MPCAGRKGVSESNPGHVCPWRQQHRLLKRQRRPQVCACQGQANCWGLLAAYSLAEPPPGAARRALYYYVLWFSSPMLPCLTSNAAAWPCSGAGELPIQGKTVKALTLLSLKRTHDLFVGNHGQKVPLDEEAQKAKIACKVGAPRLARSPAKAGATPAIPAHFRLLGRPDVRWPAFLAVFYPAVQMRDEYSGLQGFKPREAAGSARGAPAAAGKAGAAAAAAAAADSKSHTAKLIDSIPAQR